MKIKFSIIVALSVLAFVSCKNRTKLETNGTEHGEERAQPLETVPAGTKKADEKHWAYVGETSPKNWKDLEGDAACGGTSQSPINIIASDAKTGSSGLKEGDIHYSELTHINTVVNNGHSIQYNFEISENYVNFNGHRYDLVQFHFHSPSEHTINGVRYPLVMHMVHASKERDYVVFAILFEEGKESKSLDFLESYLPIEPEGHKVINTGYDFSKDLPTSFEHFHYKGSLTTPPCTEAVDWFVFTQPEIISEAQVKILADLMPVNNYRPTQAINGRTITLNK